MKKKKIRSVVFLILISLTLTGCADLASKAIDAYVEIKSENQAKSKISFSQEIKQMTLFGNTISIPCTLADLGEDFGYLEGTQKTAPGYDWVMVALTYEGKWIGMLTLSDYTEGADITQLYIEGIGFGFDDEDTSLSASEKKELYESEGKYGDKIDFSFAGLNFDSTQEEIVERLGKPHEKTETQWDYNYQEGYVQFNFHNGKIVEMDVETY